VIWTDVVQMFIYIGGTVVAIATLGTHVPGGWAQIHTVAAAAGKFHLFHFALNLSETYTFWAGVLGGTFSDDGLARHGPVDGAADAGGAQSPRIAHRTAVERRRDLPAVLTFPVDRSGALCVLRFAPYRVCFGRSDLPDVHRARDAIGIAGLLVAAILAAAMSNLSAALNSLSSTTVVDFYMHWRPEADDRERMMISRSSTVVWAFVLFAVAVYSVHAGGKGHVVEVGLSIASVAYGALLGVFLLGTLTRYATDWSYCGDDLRLCA